MQFRIPAWSATYAHDRRKHRHQCRVCRRNINAGEAVFMAKIEAKKTRAVHEACADVQHGTAAWTWRDAMKWWAFEHQLKCFGVNVYNRAHDAQIERYRVQADVMRPPQH